MEEGKLVSFLKRIRECVTRLWKRPAETPSDKNKSAAKKSGTTRGSKAGFAHIKSRFLKKLEDMLTVNIKMFQDYDFLRTFMYNGADDVSKKGNTDLIGTTWKHESKQDENYIKFINKTECIISGLFWGKYGGSQYHYRSEGKKVILYGIIAKEDRTEGTEKGSQITLKKKDDKTLVADRPFKRSLKEIVDDFLQAVRRDGFVQAVFGKKIYYLPLSTDDFFRQFSIYKSWDGSYSTVLDKDKLKEAYTKAWELRTFEIDKFWSRSAFFWGFIAAIFVGYTALTANKAAPGVEFLLLLLGLVFSVIWLLNLIGSKAWQDNWEKHIDMLEDNISGPLYKSIWYEGNKFFSLAKLSRLAAWTVIFFWAGLIMKYIHDNDVAPWSKDAGEPDWFIIISLALVFLWMAYIYFRSSGKYYSEKENFIQRWEDYDQCEFIKNEDDGTTAKQDADGTPEKTGHSSRNKQHGEKKRNKRKRKK